jgi:hypothetical protein
MSYIHSIKLTSSCSAHLEIHYIFGGINSTESMVHRRHFFNILLQSILLCAQYTTPKVEDVTLPERLSSSPVFSGVHVTRSLDWCVCFVDRCLTFCPFSFGHCVVCPSSISGIWLSLWYLQGRFPATGNFLRQYHVITIPYENKTCTFNLIILYEKLIKIKKEIR